METPASIYSVRIPTPTGHRRPNATELALAALVYSHARADHDLPVCTRPIGTVAAMLGRKLSRVQDASRVLESAGYWRRARVGGSLWRWEILVHPAADGHRWLDTLDGSGGPSPDPGVPKNGDPSPRTGTPKNGDPPPDLGVLGSPDPGTQHQQEIREEASASNLRAARLARADAINAQAENAEALRRAHPPTRMGVGTSASDEHQALRERFQAVLGTLEPGPERARLAACGLATPMPEVLRRASDELGGLDRVAEVLEWAWAEVAAGRLTSFGRAEASTALRDAFRGEGRYWRGVLEAYGRRTTVQRSLAWTPPDLGDLEPATLDELHLPDWRSAR